MNETDYRAHDAVGLADLIRRKEITAAEALEAAIARAEAVNGRLNAINLPLYDSARASAAGAVGKGPLAGVPFLLKDLGAYMAGVPTAAGSKVFATSPPAADNAVVTAYREAGLVVFGKTNTPEFGLEPVTEPELFGPSRNPWNSDHTPGGSSGGAAAAVAAGIVPAAHASDGGGSIRIPASCCGLFGMKPSRGRVSLAPADEGWGGFSIQHVVSRTVRDSAVLLDVVSRPQPGDPYWAPPSEQPFAQEAGRDAGILKVAFTTQAIASGAIDPVCADAVRDAARLCQDLGHHVEEIKLDWEYEPVREAAGLIVAANIATLLNNEAARRGSEIGDDEIDAYTLALYRRGREVAASQYIRALQIAHAFGRLAARTFQGFDVLLTSTLGLPPPPVGWLRGGDPRGYQKRLFEFMPNTQAFNVTGQPAMTVPLAWTRDGLPVGVQFVGQPAGEGVLFRLAAQLEKARPWASRLPPV
jgi:Asp-tRNA(Asn)/Glu-tRNA(Gln) amidotransferase A subunit family amidase